MPEERAPRKSATIFVADVVGYSHLMHVDEEATIEIPEEFRGVIAQLVTPIIGSSSTACSQLCLSGSSGRGAANNDRGTAKKPGFPVAKFAIKTQAYQPYSDLVRDGLLLAGLPD